jgi:hypothetical protein
MYLRFASTQSSMTCKPVMNSRPSPKIHYLEEVIENANKPPFITPPMLVIFIIVVSLCKSADCEVDREVFADRCVVKSSGIILNFGQAQGWENPFPQNVSLSPIEANHTLAKTSGCGGSRYKTCRVVSEVSDLVASRLQTSAARCARTQYLAISTLSVPIVGNLALIEFLIVARRPRWLADGCALKVDAELALAANLVGQFDELKNILLHTISMLDD